MHERVPAGGVDLLLLWHMHQPDYRDRATGEFLLPWVYLHATKDYADMAWHLEKHPGLRAVVNFVPVLLDQIEDYCAQFDDGPLRDPLLRLLARGADTPLSDAERTHAFAQCFRANHHRLIAPFPAYQRLYDLFGVMQAQGGDSSGYLSDRYIFDLVTWYHLSWIGESVRRESEPVARLMARGEQFTHAERLALLDVVAEQVRAVIPRYRALAARGQIELSSTPHFHPLAPLLLDFGCARDALPEIDLPASAAYPGGTERVQFHIDSARASHARRFGAAPRGMWPAEGAVSNDFANMLARSGVAWCASGAGVLANSLRAHGDAREGTSLQDQHRPYRLPEHAPGMLMFFRDDRLSDLIGFTYSKWHGRDAAHNFVHELESIAQRAAHGPRPVVSVMLDGENAWEYYPYNGYFFLSEVYRLLDAHPRIRTMTGSALAEAYAEAPAEIPSPETAPDAAGLVPLAAPRPLPALCAGSWVYGNLATWIGARDKNRAWDLLCAAKICCDQVLARDALPAEVRDRALAQLADCEASDWFWWPGEDNPSAAIASFDALFRGKLVNLYLILGQAVPEELRAPFATSAGHDEHAEAGGTMRRGGTSGA